MWCIHTTVWAQPHLGRNTVLFSNSVFYKYFNVQRPILSISTDIDVSLSLSVCLSVCLSVMRFHSLFGLIFSVSLSLPLRLSLSLSVSLYIYVYICLTIFLFIYTYIHFWNAYSFFFLDNILFPLIMSCCKFIRCQSASQF